MQFEDVDRPSRSRRSSARRATSAHALEVGARATAVAAGNPVVPERPPLRVGAPWDLLGAVDKLISSSTVGGIPAGLETPCSEWRGATKRGGYGQVRVDNDRVMLTHKVAYLVFCGDIPDGMEVHHLCGNTACWWPDHLELRPKGQHQATHNALRRAVKKRRVQRKLRVRVLRESEEERDGQVFIKYELDTDRRRGVRPAARITAKRARAVSV
jgi:hypothetical protein